MTDWISIEDKKPAIDEIVLVWLPKQRTFVCLRYDPNRNVKNWVSHVWYEEPNWSFKARDAGQFMPIVEPVTHWMPLPEPPNASE